MRKITLRSFLVVCLGLSSVVASAQQRERRWLRGYKEPEFSEPTGWSLGLNVGMSDLWADVGTQSIADHYLNGKYFDNATFMGGLYLRYTAAPALAFRLQASYGSLYANDNWNQKEAEKALTLEEDAVQRYIRNQDVRSRIWEGLFLIEFMPLRMNPESAIARRRFQPYLATGVGAFNFKSQTTWTSKPNSGGGGYGQWVDLYDLHIEGENFGAEAAGIEDAPEDYDRWQLNIPLTLGVRWDIGKEVAVGLEYCYRYTMTDYIDGVSNKYVDPLLYDILLPENKEAIARDVSDKTWMIIPGAKAAPGTFRGNPDVNDGYSTISVNFFWKIRSRKQPWWF